MVVASSHPRFRRHFLSADGNKARDKPPSAHVRGRPRQPSATRSAASGLEIDRERGRHRFKGGADDPAEDRRSGDPFRVSRPWSRWEDHEPVHHRLARERGGPFGSSSTRWSPLQRRGPKSRRPLQPRNHARDHCVSSSAMRSKTCQLESTDDVGRSCDRWRSSSDEPLARRNIRRTPPSWHGRAGWL